MAMSLNLGGLATQLAIPIWLLAIVLIWTMIWKGIALWKSSRKNHMVWFIVLLLLNTMGILEILYIFVFSKISDRRDSKKK